MTHNIYIYIAIMAGVSFLIRTLAADAHPQAITNRFLRSFLFYVPYVTLAVMTFPAIVPGHAVAHCGRAGARVGHGARLQRRKPVHRRGLLLRRRADCGVDSAVTVSFGNGRPFLRERTAFDIEPPVSSCYNGCIQLGGARNRPLQQTKGRLFYAQRCFPDYQP